MKHLQPLLIAVLAVMLASTYVGAAGRVAPQQVTVAGAIGTAFTYQGQLQNGGTPTNGSYDFQFVLYDAAVGGSQVAGSPIVTRNGVAVANGVFNVSLDFGAVFNGAQYYLEVGVRPSGGSAYTTLSPRQALSPTPYALYAANAGTVPWSGVSGRPTISTQRRMTISGTALSPSSGSGIAPAQWGVRVAGTSSTALGFVVPQPADWDNTKPFTVTVYFALPVGPGSNGTVNWRLRAGGARINAPPSEANNGWDSLYFWTNEDGTPTALPNVTGGYFDLMKSQSWVAKYSSTYNTWYFGNSVTSANSFKDNPIWYFAFQRGASASNGESYTGDLVVVAAEISYTAR